MKTNEKLFLSIFKMNFLEILDIPLPAESSILKVSNTFACFNL